MAKVFAFTVGLLLLLGSLEVAFTRKSRTYKMTGLTRKARQSGDIFIQDDPLFSVEPIPPLSKIGECTCECCEEPQPLKEPPPCANDVLVAVDSSACFRDYHRKMKNFLEKFTHELNKRVGFGGDKTRMGIMQFSSNIRESLNLTNFKSYSDPSTSRALRDLVKTEIRRMPFLGEGSYLNKALNKSVEIFQRDTRTPQQLEDFGGYQPRKVLVIMTNGNSHPDVTYDDIEYSADYLAAAGITIFPITVTQRCSGENWQEGLCPDLNVMQTLADVGKKEENAYLPLRSASTVSDLVDQIADCAAGQEADPAPYTGPSCNNCTCSCELPIGPQGEIGPQGPKGDFVEGPQGPKGEVGDVGPKGEVGAKGDQGERGPKGVPGEVGPEGAKGEVGEVGPKGDTGEGGPKGDQGDRGERGPRGPEGPQGEKGDEGEVGPKGEVGAKGDVGPQGERGPKGEYGEKGSKGEDGISIKGEKGMTGDEGPKGDVGIPGRKGDPGMKGMQGLCGKPGPAGVPGPAGFPGIDGIDGPTGPEGIQGPRGPEGIQGQRGLRGFPGENGADGAIGLPGAQGPQGPQGERGPQGAKGEPSNVAGPRGPSGVDGQKGERGVAGQDGLDGFQGPRGPQGLRGDMGPPGPPGVIDLEQLRPIIAEIVSDLLPGECAASPGQGIDIEDGEPAPPDYGDGWIDLPGGSRGDGALQHNISCENSKTDLVFVLDGSSSVGKDGFKELKTFLNNIVYSFGMVSQDSVRIAIIQYNEEPRIEFELEQATDMPTVLNAIRSLTYGEGNTRTGLALNVVSKIFLESYREGANKVVVIITDGRSQDDVAEPASVLKNLGAQIFAIGVRKPEQIELWEMASGIKSEHIFNIQEYSQISQIQNNFLRTVCSNVQGTLREYLNGILINPTKDFDDLMPGEDGIFNAGVLPLDDEDGEASGEESFDIFL